MKRSAFIINLFAGLLVLCLVISLPASSLAAALSQPTRPGDRGVQVRLLQEELGRRGFYQGATDGIYNGSTIRAVEAFQRARKLPVDGVAGAETLLALLGWQALDGQGPSRPQTASPPPRLPAPSGPGDAGPHVRMLQQALHQKGYDPGIAEGAFTMETLTALIAFQADHGLRADGRAGDDTLRVLFGLDLRRAEVPETPYWYGGGSEVIPWGATFQVQDVRSGITFTARRMGGYSHIDAEPLLPADTFAMQQAYNGEWSWDRRPILLSYQGHIYAASMNGMPHGFSSIKDNAMPGHFCIHLFGSRGDASQRVDAAHLACVVEASQARWQEPAY